MINASPAWFVDHHTSRWGQEEIGTRQLGFTAILNFLQNENICVAMFIYSLWEIQINFWFMSIQVSQMFLLILYLDFWKAWSNFYSFCILKMKPLSHACIFFHVYPLCCYQRGLSAKTYLYSVRNVSERWVDSVKNFHLNLRTFKNIFIRRTPNILCFLFWDETWNNAAFAKFWYYKENTVQNVCSYKN